MVSVQTKRWIGSSLLMLWSLLAASCATGRSKRVKRVRKRSFGSISGSNQNVQLHMWREKKKSEMIDGLLFILHLGLLLSKSFLPFHKFPTSASSLEDLSTPFSVSSYPSSINGRDQRSTHENRLVLKNLVLVRHFTRKFWNLMTAPNQNFKIIWPHFC